MSIQKGLHGRSTRGTRLTTEETNDGSTTKDKKMGDERYLEERRREFPPYSF